MFYGEFDYKIDEKGRVPIPPRFRNYLKDGMILAPGQEKCIIAYTPSEWKKLATELIMFSMKGFGCPKLPEKFCTGSSIMTRVVRA